ncbi:mannose-1-phosphate guanylyltransferase [Erythrobacter sp. QSSC1-22B]|uniref:mannose-1-phosphate guanylyltransferase n=1 Tax=Erythrobacter sp. QSSC1-22B TaxID=1860125 RepID=UPI000804D5BA|nr:mannose-1-phosphate guanylyltransferase [Erythrobacter sp. QSSC1-22B]OBX19427.1 mannose-1-phosphate guanylyltransferase [Erythrobacter sp. QSSC1-22B]
MTAIHPVILCGGSGTRLWPRSRPARPKPFLDLLGGRTLFQRSLDRVGDLARFAPPLIVAGAAHVDAIEEQATMDGGARLLVEPAARNTAPAIALAAHSLAPEDIMLVCPSDHHIANEAAFLVGVERAARLAREDWLVAFGIAPTEPATGYGYIRIGEALDDGHRVARFVEKPDLATAQAFLASGDHVWNGGIFCMRAGAYLEELARHRPAMAASVGEAMADGENAGWQWRPKAAPFAAIAGESIDYAVMENTDRAAVVSANMGWSDIGSWDAVLAARTRDAEGNSTTGRAELVDCRNVLVESDGPRVSAIGLEDVVIVVDGDEVLVTTRAGAQAVGKLPGATGK